MGDLVRYGEIEAVDASDLLSQFSANLEVIAEKNRIKEREIWVENEKRNIEAAYTEKASSALCEQWKLCKKTRHDYRNIDFRGVTIRVCQDCSFADENNSYGLGEEYNDELIKNLAKRLISLDGEAGILAWPTVEDYRQPSIVKPSKFIRLARKIGG